jgi:hypothetical protein
MNNETKALLIALRRALIMALGAIEDSLGLPRTVPNRTERRKA